jgi:hypothetical protein
MPVSPTNNLRYLRLLYFIGNAGNHLHVITTHKTTFSTFLILVTYVVVIYQGWLCTCIRCMISGQEKLSDKRKYSIMQVLLCFTCVSAGTRHRAVSECHEGDGAPAADTDPLGTLFFIHREDSVHHSGGEYKIQS